MKGRAAGSDGLLVAAGEFFLDLIFYDLSRLPRLGEELKVETFSTAPGGGAAITAAAAARLGRAVQLMTVWGDSPLDAMAQSLLRSCGVDSSLSRVQADGSSGLTVSVSIRSDRYFLTFPGVNPLVEEYLVSEQGSNRLMQARHVHFALTPVRWAPFPGLIEQLKQGGVSTSWDLGWDPAAAAAPEFRELCSRVDVLFLNEMEALRYCDTSSVEDALSSLATPQNTVSIKLGSKGAIASAKGAASIRVDGLPVDAVDSTGAGDAFDGGFLHFWMNDEPLEDCLLAGNICGGLSTRSAGGVGGLPLESEFAALLEQVKKRR